MAETACGAPVYSGDGPAVTQSVNDPLTLERSLPSDTGMLLTPEQTEDRVEDTIRARAMVRRTARAPVTLRVLVLSAGGQYGAYGAGFLTGWSQNKAAPRPSFDLVTGVSAGAILAPVAQAGSEFDPLLEPWRGLSDADVLRRLNPLRLIASPAVTDASPLEQLVERQLTDPLIARLARQDAAKARTLISAVDLESARAQVFDLGAVSGSDLPVTQKRRCLTEAILASAAVPGLFPPRNIDGRLYVDGGLRDQLFLASLEEARAAVARDTGRRVDVDVRVVLNGALDLPDGPVEDRLPNYFIRSTQILSDEVLRNSVRRVIAFAAARPGWTLHGVVGRVNLDPCGEESGAFDACVTRTLFDAGLSDGRAVPIRWLDANALGTLAESPGAGPE